MQTRKPFEEYTYEELVQCARRSDDLCRSFGDQFSEAQAEAIEAYIQALEREGLTSAWDEEWLFFHITGKHVCLPSFLCKRNSFAKKVF